MSKVSEIFREICENNSRKTAIYSYENDRMIRRNYYELARDVNSCVNFLANNDIKAGDRIFIFTPTSYRLTVFMLAAFQLGIQVMFIDIHARQETFKKLFTKFEPDYVLVSNRTALFRPFFKSIAKIKRVINVDKIQGDETKIELPDIPDDAPALLTTTTGSTGMPKIVVRSHQDLYNQLDLLQKNLPKSGSPVIMSTSYIYLFAVLASGDTAVLPRIQLDKSAKKINKQLSHYAHVPITIIITSPVFGIKADNFFPKLERMYIGGASINLDQALTIAGKFPKSQNYIVYGATECNIMTHCGLKTYIKNLTTNYRSTLGKPFNGVTLKIDKDDNILVSCTALIKGFINDERKYDCRKIDWYNTNDKGFIEDGVLYYRGKYNYYITHKGERYYNHEIEQYITVSCPEIKKCAIVQKRNRITLFLTEKVDEAKVSTILAQKYDFKVKYRYIPAIPHDTRHHTKTDYKQLLKIA